MLNAFLDSTYVYPPLQHSNAIRYIPNPRLGFPSPYIIHLITLNALLPPTIRVLSHIHPLHPSPERIIHEKFTPLPS